MNDSISFILYLISSWNYGQYCQSRTRIALASHKIEIWSGIFSSSIHFSFLLVFGGLLASFNEKCRTFISSKSQIENDQTFYIPMLTFCPCRRPILSFAGDTPVNIISGGQLSNRFSIACTLEHTNIYIYTLLYV